jgi:hypothetical protein
MHTSHSTLQLNLVIMQAWYITLDTQSIGSRQYLHIFSWDELNRTVAPGHKIKIDSERASPAIIASKDTVSNAIPAR